MCSSNSVLDPVIAMLITLCILIGWKWMHLKMGQRLRPPFYMCFHCAHPLKHTFVICNESHPVYKPVICPSCHPTRATVPHFLALMHIHPPIPQLLPTCCFVHCLTALGAHTSSLAPLSTRLQRLSPVTMLARSPWACCSQSAVCMSLRFQDIHLFSYAEDRLCSGPSWKVHGECCLAADNG